MTTLVAVAFPDESTASAAAEDVRWLALDVRVDADAVAVASRDRFGAFHLTTNHGPAGGIRWGIFWVLLFETLFEHRAPEAHARSGRSRSPRADAALDDPFRQHLADMLTPGTSALFLAVDDVISDEAVRELTRLGGVLVTWGLTADATQVVQSALRGMTTCGGGRLWPHDGGRSAPDAAPPANLLLQPGQTCGSV